MIKGQAGQVVGAEIVTAAGAAYGGAVSVYIDGDHTGQVLGSVGGGAASNRGNGYYDYIPSAAETSYNHIAFTFVPAAAVPVTVAIDTITQAQIASLQAASGLSSVVVNQLLLEAFIEIRFGRAMDTLEPELLDWGLGKLNRMLDKWNADPMAKYNAGFTSYTPTTNHQPHTIGPSGADWSAPLGRPNKITGANLILNTSNPSVRIPITVRDEYWWLNNAVQGLATSIVTDLYYDDTWPNGSVYLWPIPTAAYPIELLTDVKFSRYAMTDTLWLPDGYREAVTLTLAELLAPGCGQTASPDLKEAAKDARVIVFGQNVKSRNISTRDGGMPGRSGRSGGYLYRTGFTKDA